MLLTSLVLVVALPIAAQTAGPLEQVTDDPALRTVVERFFATQQAKDVEGYLALWSKTAQRPRPEQLKYVFDTGDDQFSDITIQRVVTVGGSVRVRVSVARSRTDLRAKRPDGTPITFDSRYITSLTFVREGEEWKLVREGTPADELALALMAASTEAERLALLDAESELLDQRLSDALSRRGDAEAQTGRYAAAQQIYERVLEVARRIGDKKAEGQALHNIGNSLYFQRQFSRALEMYEQRLAIEREASNDEALASALSGIGTVRYAQFEYGAALASYRDALAIQERLDDSMAVASTAISIGNVLYLQGDFEGAIVRYRRSRESYQRLMYKAGEARALEGLGLAYAALGDLASALDSYREVLDESGARNDARGQGAALFSIGEIHFRLGNLETARPLFDQSRTFFESSKDLPNAGRSWQGVAITDLASARFAGAEQAYVKSQEACAAADDKECVARAIVGLAFALASQERFDEAVMTYRRAIESFLALEKLEEAARAEVGHSRALAGKKDYRAAVAAAGRARARATAIGSDDVLWRASIAEARAQRRLGSFERAMQAAKDAVATVARLDESVLERPGMRVASDTTAAFGLLAVLQAEDGDAAAALVTAEQLRAHALRVALAPNERDIHRGMTSAERDEERELATELASLHVQREKEKQLPKPDAARLARLETSIREATARRAAQRRQLFDTRPELRTWRALGPPAAIGALALQPGDLVAQFVIDDEDLLVLTAAGGEEGSAVAAYVVAIARQKLAERVAHAIEPASLRDAGAWRKTIDELVAIMPAPFLEQLAVAVRVTMLPDDVLWRVPFEALPIEDGYLADRATVRYAGSIASLVVEPAPSSEAPSLPMLAVGAPDLAAATRERLKATAPGWTLRAPEVAEREMKRAASVYVDPPSVVQAGATATEGAFRAQAEQAALLHIAAPFRMNAASPLFSPVLLAPSAEATQEPSAGDGVLEVREVLNASLKARAAILTDGAAASMLNAADAMPAVQWAWLAAGVPALILPRWIGEDTTSEEFVAELHKHLEDGDAPGHALQQARAAIRRREETRAPYFWASWMLLGRDR